METPSVRAIKKKLIALLRVINICLFLFYLAPYEPFKTFKYAGPLRAVYPLSPRRTVPEDIPRPDYAETGKIFYFIFGGTRA